MATSLESLNELIDSQAEEIKLLKQSAANKSQNLSASDDNNSENVMTKQFQALLLKTLVLPTSRVHTSLIMKTKMTSMRETQRLKQTLLTNPTQETCQMKQPLINKTSQPILSMSLALSCWISGFTHLTAGLKYIKFSKP